MKILSNPQAIFSIGSKNTATVLYFTGNDDGKLDAENFAKFAFSILGINSAQASQKGINKPKSVQIDKITKQYCVYLTPADVNEIINFHNPRNKRKF